MHWIVLVALMATLCFLLGFAVEAVDQLARKRRAIHQRQYDSFNEEA